MPITPHQAKQSQKAASSADLHIVMGNIDKYLSSGPTGRTEWWYNTNNVIKGVDVEEIIRVYRLVGWKVELVNDNHDGDAIVFTIE